MYVPIIYVYVYVYNYYYTMNECIAERRRRLKLCLFRRGKERRKNSFCERKDGRAKKCSRTNMLRNSNLNRSRRPQKFSSSISRVLTAAEAAKKGAASNSRWRRQLLAKIESNRVTQYEKKKKKNDLPFFWQTGGSSSNYFVAAAAAAATQEE